MPVRRAESLEPAPGAEVKPAWPFPEFAKEESAARLAEHPDDPRDRLAALITAPENTRFAQVIVNRLWQRLMGRGIVENVGDWEKGDPSHPDAATNVSTTPQAAE